MESLRAVFKRRDNCSFRHDMNKRAKSTQPNPSPRSSSQQSAKHASRTRSLGGRSPSGKMARLPCKDHFKGTCTTPSCEKVASSRVLVLQVRKLDAYSGKSALMHTARLMNSPAKGLKIMVTKVRWLHGKLHDNWVAYFKIWSRRSLQRFCGDSLKPCYVMLTFETKINRLE